MLVCTSECRDDCAIVAGRHRRLRFLPRERRCPLRSGNRRRLAV